MTTKKTHPKKPLPLVKSEEFQNFRKALLESKRVLISTHLLPDGDGLGAQTAFFHYLKRAKKACKIYNPDLLPKRYRFLDPKNTFLLGPGEVELWDTWDLWVIVDTNDPRRLGKLWNGLMYRSKKIVFLDHHPPTDSAEIEIPPHASLISDTQSSSIGELLYQLFHELQIAKISQEVALGLYVSVMTDTNSFRYARTTPIAHRIAAEMIELGINPEEIYQSIYSSKEVSHVQLLGHLLQNVRTSSGGKLAWLEVNFELRKHYRASSDDTQSFLNLLLLLKDAEVICLFREEEEGQVRVSLKSKGRVVVNQLAMDLGGGGHEFAAGLSYSQKLDETVKTVVGRLDSLIASMDFSKNSNLTRRKER